MPCQGRSNRQLIRSSTCAWIGNSMKPSCQHRLRKSTATFLAAGDSIAISPACSRYLKGDARLPVPPGATIQFQPRGHARQHHKMFRSKPLHAFAGVQRRSSKICLYRRLSEVCLHRRSSMVCLHALKSPCALFTTCRHGFHKEESCGPQSARLQPQH